MRSITGPTPGFQLMAPSWPLGGSGYDSVQLLVIPLLALVTTLTVLVIPDLFLPVLIADLWLLGYHHVIATYTRIAMDKEMLRRHWILVGPLPLMVFAAVLALGHIGGAIVLTTIYIHWQLFHYVRQSEGISKAFASRQPARMLPNEWPIRISFYLVPAVAFLTMTSVAEPVFLGFPVWLPRIPAELLLFLQITTALSLGVATLALLKSMTRGLVSRQYATYFASHIFVFVVAYGIISDILLSWLMANIWHNSQYLAFVWKANQSRFNKESPNQPVLMSTLSKSGNWWMYFGFCLAITFAIYTVAESHFQPLLSNFVADGIVAAAVIYQTINFHHYIVDAVIWRRPKPSPSPA